MDSEDAIASKGYRVFNYHPASHPPLSPHVYNKQGELEFGSSAQLRLTREGKGKGAVMVSNDDDEKIIYEEKIVEGNVCTTPGEEDIK